MSMTDKLEKEILDMLIEAFKPLLNIIDELLFALDVDNMELITDG